MKIVHSALGIQTLPSISACKITTRRVMYFWCRPSLTYNQNVLKKEGWNRSLHAFDNQFKEKTSKQQWDTLCTSTSSLTSSRGIVATELYIHSVWSEKNIYSCHGTPILNSSYMTESFRVLFYIGPVVLNLSSEHKNNFFRIGLNAHFRLNCLIS